MENLAKLPTRKQIAKGLPYAPSLNRETSLQDEEGAWNELDTIIPVLRWVQDELNAYRSDPNRDEGPSDAVLGYIVAMTAHHLEQTKHFGHQAYFKHRRGGLKTFG